MAVTIRDVQAADEAAWRELWAGYLTFYEAALPEAVTARTWQRIIGDHPGFEAIVAEVDGEVIGFANLVIHDFTWSERPACLLHDLFVDPARRGQGTGRALIQACVDRARERGWDRVYWLTKHDNVTARRLYDTFAPADGFIRYRLPIPATAVEEER